MRVFRFLKSSLIIAKEQEEKTRHNDDCDEEVFF